MTPNEYINFSEMLTDAQLEELGISEERELSQCVVRLAARFGETRTDLATALRNGNEHLANAQQFAAKCETLTTDLAAARAEAERAKVLAVEKTAQIASLQNDVFTAHALNESRCAALAKECEELRADKERPLVELMRAYEILHAFMSTEQIQQGGTFHLNKTDGSGSNRAISNAEAFSLISRFYNSDERATNAMRDLKAGNFKCISVDSAMVEYWPIARADAARKEPPAKAHGCEVGE